MRKNKYGVLAFALVCSQACLTNVWAQTNQEKTEQEFRVTREVTKQNVLLEEFTGIHCGYCPQGHAIAKQMKRASAQVYSVAIHAGYYASPSSDEPDFRTAEGDTLNTHFEISSYPSGMVNRTPSTNSSLPYARGRNEWTGMAKEIVEKDAPLNLLATARYDATNRSLNIHVEGYLTTDIEEDCLTLNVLWTQDGLTSWQNGGNMGLDYVHKDMLRGYVTPVWGDTLTERSKGSLFSRDYEYTVPEELKETPVEAQNIHVIAFVTAGKDRVQQVTGTTPDFGEWQTDLSAEIETAKISVGKNYGFQFFELRLQNLSTQDIESASFDVNVNGETTTCDWQGHIEGMGAEDIRIEKTYNTVTTGMNEYVITLKSLNGQEVEKKTLKGQFATPVEATPTIVVGIKTNMEATDNRYLIRDDKGETVMELGPYGNAETVKDTVTLEAGKTYCVEVTDSWGDGIYSPSGYLVVRSADNSLVAQLFDIPGFGIRTFFKTSKADTGIEDLTTEQDGNDRQDFFLLNGSRLTDASQLRQGVVIIRNKRTGESRKIIQ